MNKELINNNPIISLGAPFGIGYEIFLLSLKKNNLKKFYPLVCIGSEKIIHLFQKLLNFKISFISITNIDNFNINSINIKNNKFILINIDQFINFKKYNLNNINLIDKKLDGTISYKTIEIAAKIVEKKYFKSVITLPVNKKNINQIDPSFKGHTEFFQKKWKEKFVYMTFISKKINILLLTTHIPLNEVSKNITEDKVKNGIKFSLKLKNKLNINKPICFLGLNPHAGENGLLGKEDLMINNIIKKYGKNKIIGPIPSDTAFTKYNFNKFGIFISCYHDQGLIPFKMLSFEDGVNLSFGMKYIRTSVDHGTACDLIGMKKANLNSFLNAYNLAYKLS